MEQKEKIAVLKVSSKDSFFELKPCFSIDKIYLGFFRYDSTAAKGNRITDQVNIYLSIIDAAYLGHKLSDSIVATGEILTPFLVQAKLNKAEASKSNSYAKEVFQMLGGTDKGGNIVSRMLRIEVGQKYPLVFRALSGPGKKTEEGLIAPLYEFKAAEQKVLVPLTKEDSIKVGLALLETVSMYYRLNADKFI